MTKPKELIINGTVHIPTREFRFSFARSSGPGGQNVNKVNTKAVLNWDLEASALPAAIKARLRSLFPRRITAEGELTVNSDRFRTREDNIAACLAKVQEMVRAAAVRPKRRVATKVTRAAQEKRLQTKKRHSETKHRRGRRHFNED